MDSQPHIADIPEGMSILRFGSVLFPSNEFATVAANFPATYCFPHFQERGEFYLSFYAYENGRKFGELHSSKINELENFQIEMSDLLRHFPSGKSGLVTLEYTHPDKIPVSMYLSSVHRKTGIYISIPALPYMGDQLNPQFHEEALESTLFWPGVSSSAITEPVILVLNPYDQVFSYQLSLFMPDGSRVVSDVFKIRPNCSSYHELDQVFAEQREALTDERGGATVCISAQFKVLAYGYMRERSSGAPIMIDHLHQYRFF